MKKSLWNKNKKKIIQYSILSNQHLRIIQNPLYFLRSMLLSFLVFLKKVRVSVITSKQIHLLIILVFFYVKQCQLIFNRIIYKLQISVNYIINAHVVIILIMFHLNAVLVGVENNIMSIVDNLEV